MMKKVVHFGAGNIGRGFIGALFSESGYHVTFVDIAQSVIDALNRQDSYHVRTASEPSQDSEIKNFSGINNQTHPEQVVAAIADAQFITTAIGPKVLPLIAPLIARALTERLQRRDDKIYVIACENQINATDQLKDEVLQAVDAETAQKLNERVAFLNAAVDRIVPLQHNEELLDVLVEDYFEWIVEASGSVPPVKGMQIVPDLAPYIERKLFTVNTGHAATAYLGYLAGKKKIHQALQDPQIYRDVKGIVEETAAYLMDRYKLDAAAHKKYMARILRRFQNPKLNDDVTRVGRSPIRKLGPNDRLVKPAKEAEKRGLPFHYLAKAMAAALRFDVPTDQEAVELQRRLKISSVVDVLGAISGLAADDPIAREVVKDYRQAGKAEQE
jgi:mannitol-1-phosphate 5-dehydrogenase